MALNSDTVSIRFSPVILAGGSGTRFWPRSRRSNAKQVLALDGTRTMIQQTFKRLLPLARPEDVWVITNDLLAAVIGQQLPELDKSSILSEPAARNTAPACALAAFLLVREDPETVLGIFPSDHVVKDEARFAEVLSAGIKLAASGDKVVVLGVPPGRAETGYGYIEQGEYLDSDHTPDSAIAVRRVKRFTEKPDRIRAEEFIASGNYAWNAGIFLWKAKTLVDAICLHCPEMAACLTSIAQAYRTPEFEQAFKTFYPQCENISIDYAVLEPRSSRGELTSEIYCLPADFGWNDLGSWAALHEHRSSMPAFADDANANVIEAPAQVTIRASGNYVYAPGMTVALVGVEDMVVVQTEDALLITTRGHCQDVGKIVHHLSAAGRMDLI